jgi:hypothetical protein
MPWSLWPFIGTCFIGFFAVFLSRDPAFCDLRHTTGSLKRNDSTGFSRVYYIKMPTLSHYEQARFPILSGLKKGFICVETATKTKA